MKNFKTIFIYGVIIFLCVAAFAGYYMSNRKDREANAGTVTTALEESGQAEAAASAETTAALQSESSIPDDENTEATTAPASETKQTETTAAGEETMKAEPAAAAAETKQTETTAVKEAAVAEESKSTKKQSDSKKDHLENLLKMALAKPDPSPVIGVGRGKDYAKVTAEAVENAGGLKGLVKKGDVVLIKPNICTIDAAGSCKTTDYRAVQQIADMVRKLGASKIIVAEGTITGNAFSEGFLELNKYDEIKGVELFDMNACDIEDCYELTPKKSLTDMPWFIPKVYMDADVVISFAKLKTHFQPDAVVSLSLKNAIGTAPNTVYGIAFKGAVHDRGLKESIVDLNRIRKPDFALIEGIVAGEGYGPLNNTPVESNIIFAGKDLVALDTVALNFMGFTIDQVPHVKLAGEENMGISDLGKITVKGADVNSIKMSFSRF